MASCSTCAHLQSCPDSIESAARLVLRYHNSVNKNGGITTADAAKSLNAGAEVAASICHSEALTSQKSGVNNSNVKIVSSSMSNVVSSSSSSSFSIKLENRPVIHVPMRTDVYDAICVDCERLGNLKDVNFLEHLVIEKHSLCVRIKHPIELFCCYCGDIQYASAFDTLVGKKRIIPSLTSFLNASSSSSIASLGKTDGTRRGTGTGAGAGSKRLNADNEILFSPHKMQCLLKQQPRGITNMGATCFMNSVLQVILHNIVVLSSKYVHRMSSKSRLPCTKVGIPVGDADELVHSTSGTDNGQINGSPTAGRNSDIHSAATTFSTLSSSTSSSTITSTPVGNAVSNGCIACELFNFLTENAFSKNSNKKSSANVPFIPSNLLYSIWSYADHMAGYEQQDAHEFLIALLDGLGNHLEKYHNDHSEVDDSGQKPNVNIFKNDVLVSKESKIANSSSINHEASSAHMGMQGVSMSTTGLAVSSSSSSDSKSSLLSPSQSAPMPITSTNDDEPDLLGPKLTRAPSFNNIGANSGCSVTVMGAAALKGFVNEVFGGTMRSDLLCQSCEHRSCKLEPFLDISLSLDVRGSTGNARLDSTMDLMDCLHHFTSIETLAELVHCGRCNIMQPTNKQLSLSSMPNVLVIHLKRFDSVKQTKLSTIVKFPISGLDLSPFRKTDDGSSKPPTSSSSPSSNSASSSSSSSSSTHDSVYDLQGLVMHKGTLSQGHYISYVHVPQEEPSSSLDSSKQSNPGPSNAHASMNIDSKEKVTTIESFNSQMRWIRCDDETVSSVTEAEVEKAEAYILFYVKRPRRIDILSKTFTK